MEGKPVQRQEVLRKMLELAAGPANDAVKLAYLSGEEEIGSLALDCLTELQEETYVRMLWEEDLANRFFKV